MTLPQSVRVTAQFPFPATVKGSGPIVIAKAQGVWTVGFTIIQLPLVPLPTDLTTKFLLVYDTATASFQRIALAGVQSFGNVRIITVAGDVAVLATDQSILMNKLVGATTNINLPTSASRGGAPLLIKDYKGDSNTNNITLVPSGAETIDGFSGAAAAANGLAKIRINYDKKIIYPLSAGGWYL